MKKIEYVKPQENNQNDLNNPSSAKVPNIKEIRLIPNSIPKKKFSFWGIFLFFIFIFFLLSFIQNTTFSMSPKTAVIKIHGTIITGGGSSILGDSYVSSKFITQKLNEIKNDKTYKAVILDVNSPGGSPVASKEISDMLIELKNNNITIYSYVRDLAASGGYWVIAPSTKIYSNELSLIGSFGVTSTGFGFENFIKDYNITYRRYIAGEYKDFLSPFREPTKEEENITKNILNFMHQKFIEHISDNRNISYDKVLEIATGEIFTSKSSKNIGLIDEVSSYNKMLDDLNREVGETILVDINPPTTFFEDLGLGSIKLSFENDLKNKIELK